MDDPAVAGIHCRVVDTPLGWWIVDDGAAHGLRRDGARIERCKLAAGVRVDLAPGVVLQLREGDVPPTARGRRPGPPPRRRIRGWAPSVLCHAVLLAIALACGIGHRRAEPPRPFEVSFAGTESVEADAGPDEESFAEEELVEVDAEAPAGVDAPAEEVPAPDPLAEVAPELDRPAPFVRNEEWSRLRRELPIAPARGPVVGASLPGPAAFGKHVETLATTGLDVALLLDATGSMGSVLDQAREGLHRVALSIGRLVPGWRLRILAYRDHGEEFVVRGPSPDATMFESLVWLRGLEAQGGGDEPEAVAEAVGWAIRHGRWRSKSRRVIVVVGDAPPHPESMTSVLSGVRAFHGAGGSVHCLDTRATPGAEFQRIAKAGGGQALALAQVESFLREILVLARGPEWRKEIEEALAGEDAALAANLAAIRAGELEPVLAKLRAGPDASVVEALVVAGDRSALPLLADLVGDSTAAPGGRWAALYAAARLAGPRFDVTTEEYRARPADVAKRLRRM